VFLKRLLATFKIEADEHLKAISGGLLELEKNPDQRTQQLILDSIYRQVHSLKGASRAVDLLDVEAICQSLESIFKDFKYNGAPQVPELFDVLQKAVDAVYEIVSGSTDTVVADVLQSLESVRLGIMPTFAPMVSPPREMPSDGADVSVSAASVGQGGGRFKREGIVRPGLMPEKNSNDDSDALKRASMQTGIGGTGTIRVSADNLDNLLLQAEEMIYMRLAVKRSLQQVHLLSRQLEGLEKKERHAADMFGALLRQAADADRSELWKKMEDHFEGNRMTFKQLLGEVRQLNQSMQTDQRVFRSMINKHLEYLRTTLMLPFATLTESFPRMIRDLSRQKGKEVELVLKGNEIEIDKRILEAMKVPLIHLLRNAVDHGIEMPEQRKKKGKPGCGSLQVTIARKEDNRVELVVADDGGGIDPQSIKQKALESAVFTADELNRFSDNELRELVFLPEFSTSPIITDLSGRGLGLSIVRETVEKLGGRIAIHSPRTGGTAFRIVLRTSLSTFRGILVICGTYPLIVPSMNVVQVFKVKRERIKTVENRETIEMSGQLISFARLRDVLQVNCGTDGAEGAESAEINVIVLEAGNRLIGFQVDRVENEEEVMVKELGKQLVRVRNIAGAVILGSGEVVPILNPLDVIKSAVLLSRQAGGLAGAGEIKPKKTGGRGKTANEDQRKSVLVVEDSITSRMLLKNILESSGYRVKTAVDGMDGWIALKEERFDVAILDVEMPRMTGFELTARIRDDRLLKNLSVVLVTSLESREDREKGIDVGADAYIVKSNFDQSNLLEVIKKLL